jgi:hypothetical protein
VNVYVVPFVRLVTVVLPGVPALALAMVTLPDWPPLDLYSTVVTGRPFVAGVTKESIAAPFSPNAPLWSEALGAAIESGWVWAATAGDGALGGELSPPAFVATIVYVHVAPSLGTGTL